MANEKNWKSNLLSSGLPLEFDAAKILVAKGFSIDSDFTYSRKDSAASGVVQDFSVDIEALAFPPFDPEGNELHAQLQLLVECKYRYPKTKWLFLPDINGDLSSFTLGYTIRVVNQFSPYTLEKKSCYEYESNFPMCYKGVEIRQVSSGQAAFDTEIKHGISQLRYSLPRLIRDTVNFMITAHPDDNNPFIFCPTLLTTADLHVAHENMSMNDVEKASEITDISDEVPYLIMFSDYGPDFEKHCLKEFKNLKQLLLLDSIKQIEAKYRASNEEIYKSRYPSAIGQGLAHAQRFYLVEYFTQFFICNYFAFPDFIDELKKAITATVETRKKV